MGESGPINPERTEETGRKITARAGRYVTQAAYGWGQLQMWPNTDHKYEIFFSTKEKNVVTQLHDSSVQFL